jgi:nitrogen fixation NifU-like protein
VYAPAFKEHLANPHNVGELTDADAIAEATNPICGDRLLLFLKVQNKAIATAQFLAYGCAPTLVCGSALTDLVKDLSVEKAKQLTRKDLVEYVGGLPARKQHAAALAIEVLQSALDELES